jgi:hypothetical protein
MRTTAERGAQQLISRTRRRCLIAKTASVSMHNQRATRNLFDDQSSLFAFTSQRIAVVPEPETNPARRRSGWRQKPGQERRPRCWPQSSVPWNWPIEQPAGTCKQHRNPRRVAAFQNSDTEALSDAFRDLGQFLGRGDDGHSHSNAAYLQAPLAHGVRAQKRPASRRQRAGQR